MVKTELIFDDIITIITNKLIYLACSCFLAFVLHDLVDLSLIWREKGFLRIYLANGKLNAMLSHLCFFIYLEKSNYLILSLKLRLFMIQRNLKFKITFVDV